MSEPPYQEYLEAMNRAQRPVLASFMDELELDGRAVLDLCCGSGLHAQLLLQRGARLTGLDSSDALLDRARRRAPSASFTTGDAYATPFDDASFDVVWLAQSLYSLSEPDRALTECRRVLREGGTIAVVENDMFHPWILPWPPDVELAVKKAELDAARDDSGDPERFFSARRLPELLVEAGFQAPRTSARATPWQAPLSEDQRTGLAGILAELWDRIEKRVDEDVKDRVQALVTPDGDDYLVDDPQLSVIRLDVLTVARR